MNNMKTWQWVALGIGVIVIVFFVVESQQKTAALATTRANSGVNSLLGGLGSLFKGASGPPSGNPKGVSPGSSGTNGVDMSGLDYTGGGAGSTNLAPGAYGSQYSAAMGDTSEVASVTASFGSAQESGGSTFAGGLGGNSSDPLGIGSLSFNTGVGGADFSS